MAEHIKWVCCRTCAICLRVRCINSVTLMQVNSRKNNFVYNKISGGLGVFRIFVARAKYEGGVRT